jgi:phosphohistidine phosphatase SixA
MDVYLIRHAEAKPLGEDGIASDAERPLTEAGEVQARELAAGLQRRRASCVTSNQRQSDWWATCPTWPITPAG